MYARAATVLALASAVSAQSLGAAMVTNNCANSVYLWNVPSAGGGGTEVDQTIAPGQTYSQTYQSLTTGTGWSLKLAPTDSESNLMQFEYTYQNAGVVWFDISYVNGDPFNSDWFLSASDPTCVPKQTYYRYSTDDQNGMQPTCSPSNNIILTLCPGGAPESGSSSSSSSAASSSSADQSHDAPPSTTAAPTQPILAAAPVVDAVFTTFITQVITVDVTAIEKRNPEPTAPAKRDAHAHDHQHFHRHAHAHAHL